MRAPEGTTVVTLLDKSRRRGRCLEVDDEDEPAAVVVVLVEDLFSGDVGSFLTMTFGM